MSQGCSCCQLGHPAAEGPLSINHCCGGHLTLAEASAAAGLSVDTVVAALGHALTEPGGGAAR
jgi:hypothetical protein